jgi:hypothetical protein
MLPERLMNAWEQLKETDALKEAKQAQRRKRDEAWERLRKGDNEGTAPTKPQDEAL